MDMSDFYKNISKKFDSTFHDKQGKSGVSEKMETRTFSNVDDVMDHMRENKERVFSVRDELCEEFGEEQGRQMYRFLRKLARKAAAIAGMSDDAIPGVLFTPGGGTFTCIGSRKS